MQRKCSIITVNLNNKSGLEKTIRSVLEQTAKDFEYIIIDGASTDGSLGVIQQYSNQIGKWVSETDTGVYNAMNKGAAMATGEYLLFLNSGDTLLHHNVIERVFPCLETNDVDIVYGDLRFDYDTHYEDYHYPDKLTFDFFYERSLGHPAAFIRKTVFEHLGGYEDSYPICADWVFFTKAICLHTHSYKHLPFVIANFKTDGVSSMAENRERIIAERRRALNGPFVFLTGSYEKYFQLKNRLESLRRSKPYRFLKLLGLPKYR